MIQLKWHSTLYNRRAGRKAEAKAERAKDYSEEPLCLREEVSPDAPTAVIQGTQPRLALSLRLIHRKDFASFAMNEVIVLPTALRSQQEARGQTWPAMLMECRTSSP